MAAKPETTFTTSVHRHLPPKLHREKMCNPYRGGTWDMWYSGQAADLWVEYKFVVLPKRESTPIDFDLSELQLKWGDGRLNEGRELAVIVGCKEGGVLLLNQEWRKPFDLKKFKPRIWARDQLAGWINDITGGPP